VRCHTDAIGACLQTCAVPDFQNHLIAALPSHERKALLAACELVPLTLGEVLCEAASTLRHAYFPQSGFISLVVTLDGKPSLEVGMVGAEGMLGATLALGVRTVPLHALVQGEGHAQRITAVALHEQLDRSDALKALVDRYLHACMGQLALASACTRFHKIGPRLARWLLMSHDRCGSDTFHLTHEFIAYMLGVRRVGITQAAEALQQQGLIAYRRGEITIIDRARLEALACSCYEVNRRAELTPGRSRVCGSRQTAPGHGPQTG